MEKPQHLIARTLKERGWTATMITRFLDPPDKLAVNPNYKSGPPMKLYELGRVEQAEKTEEFKAAKERGAKRSAIAKKVTDAKRDRLITEVEGFSVSVRQMERQALTKAAITHYNQRLALRSFERGDIGEMATKNSPAAFIERITVNYVRHMRTKYDRNLETLFGKIGKEDAIAVIRRRIYGAIAEAYPDLAGECARQLADRDPNGHGGSPANEPSNVLCSAHASAG